MVHLQFLKEKIIFAGAFTSFFSLTCSQDKTQFLSRHNEQLFILSFANNGSHTEGYFKNYLGLLYFMPVYMKQTAWICVMRVYMCG